MSRKSNYDYCIVKNCNSQANRNESLSFHRFPKPGKRKVNKENLFGNIESIDQLQAWKIALKMKNVLPTMRICSLHFEKDDYILPDAPGKRILKRTAVPSLNLIYKNKVIEKNRARESRRLKRASTCENLKKKKLIKLRKDQESNISENMTCITFEDNEHAAVVNRESTSNGPGYEIIQSTSLFFKDESVQTDSALFLQDATSQTSTPSSHNASVQAYTAPLLKEVFVQATVPFKYVHLITTNKKLSCVTGIENFDILNCIVDIVNTATGNRFTNLKMNTLERIVMTFMKLKQNLSYNFLAVTFHCYSDKQCQRVFHKTLRILSECLMMAIAWPSKEEILKNIPKCFEGFENVRIVLDCTEIFIQQPKNLCCQLLSYSHYKGSTTAKVMTGVSPSGNICYLSKVYGGRVSDTTIFSQSKDLLQLLEKGDGIMVDRGFLIDELCEGNRWKCIRPPFLHDKKQFSTAESILTSKIASARVHIERSNQRIKTFKIVGSKLPVSLVKVLPQILTVICATINLSSPILSNEKFTQN